MPSTVLQQLFLRRMLVGRHIRNDATLNIYSTLIHTNGVQYVSYGESFTVDPAGGLMEQWVPGSVIHLIGC